MDDAGSALDEDVPLLVPELVVGGFQIVHVQHHQAHRVDLLPHGFQAGKPLIKGSPVADAGEPVLIGKLTDQLQLAVFLDLGHGL